MEEAGPALGKSWGSAFEDMTVTTPIPLHHHPVVPRRGRLATISCNFTADTPYPTQLSTAAVPFKQSACRPSPSRQVSPGTGLRRKAAMGTGMSVGLRVYSI